MKIGGLQKFTLIDFPGRLATTVFLANCNFRCSFCYSSEIVLPEKVKNQPMMSEQDFFEFLDIRKTMLEGVVICGGEPTLNNELPIFAEKIKKMGYAVKLDTNGSAPWMVKSMLRENLLDYVAMDIKAPENKYAQITGNDDPNLLEKINDSIDVLKNSGIDHEFRTTIVPGLLGKKDIIEIAKWIGPAKKYFVQNFRGEKTIDPTLENLRPYDDEYLLEIQKAVSPFFEICQVR